MHDPAIPVVIVILEQVIPCIVAGLILFGRIMFGRIAIAGASLFAGVAIDIWTRWGTDRMDGDAVELMFLGICGLLCALKFRECLVPIREYEPVK